MESTVRGETTGVWVTAGHARVVYSDAVAAYDATGRAAATRAAADAAMQRDLDAVNVHQPIWWGDYKYHTNRKGDCIRGAPKGNICFVCSRAKQLFPEKQPCLKTTLQ